MMANNTRIEITVFQGLFKKVSGQFLISLQAEIILG